MSVLWIKIIAVTTMVIDHIGLLFFPEDIYFRAIGRISFPLFAWLIANGVVYSSNRIEYLKRLFFLAILSQLPYSLFTLYFVNSVLYLNILFTLCLGLLVIIMFEKVRSQLLGWGLVLAAAALSEYLTLDYGSYGILSIFLFYYFYKNKLWMIISQTTLFIIEMILTYVTGDPNYINYLKPVVVFSLLLLLFYNGKEGLKIKWFFYLFYPLHLLVLYLIWVIF